VVKHSYRRGSLSKVAEQKYEEKEVKRGRFQDVRA